MRPPPSLQRGQVERRRRPSRWWKASASSVRAFHLRTGRIEGPIGGLVFSISKTIAWWSLCVYRSLTAHEDTLEARASLTKVRSMTEAPRAPAKVGVSPALSNTASRRLSESSRMVPRGLVSLHPHSVDQALKSPATTSGLLPRASSVMSTRRAENSASLSLGGA
ncbi:unnamed protein product [Trichogramma brassicae]|uniref:Uncharacterized protein n=1 Tax=Trichogramma brassicae TaxID=86971 RepID=A0A6H5IPK6_9HYME|nr:unnamed protein product [Trichogramma brassicae]